MDMKGKFEELRKDYASLVVQEAELNDNLASVTVAKHRIEGAMNFIVSAQMEQAVEDEKAKEKSNAS